MALRVPKSYISSLQLVRSLSQSDADRLLKALDSAHIASSSQEMADNIAPSVKGIPKENLDKIVDLLYALYHVREFSELNRADFLKELVDSVRDHADPHVAKDELPVIKERFKNLLRVKSLESISKALVLQRQHERVFCQAKLISDIRPVFGDNVKSTPAAATISHVLHIRYHENGDHREFYLMLDRFDLDKLEEVIKRAKQKDATLDKALSDAKIPRLGM